MHSPNIIILQLPPTLVSFLEINADPAAERLQILNRLNGELVAHRRVNSGNTQVFLPLDYSSSSTLMCVMLDDNSEFNAAIVDNVQPILVDLIKFDPINPLPYEPPP
jgi:hypothetical protein